MKYPFRLIRIAFPALRKNRHFMAVIGNAHERFPCFQYNGGIVRIFFPLHQIARRFMPGDEPGGIVHQSGIVTPEEAFEIGLVAESDAFEQPLV